MTNRSGWHDSPGAYHRPIAVEGDVEFLEFESRELADEAHFIFGVQWDYVHGGIDALDLLPDTFEGFSVVKSRRVLDELARRGNFDIEELYRELFE